jgi:hypothetical protein
MEKFETKKYKTPYNTTISLYGWRFTKEEKNALQAALKKFDSVEVEKFLNVLEFLCDAMMFMKTMPKRADLRYEKDRILRRFKNAIEELKRIADRRVLLDYWDDIKYIAIEEYAEVATTRENERWRMAMDALVNLQKLKKILESLKPPGGRPSADEYGFVYRIALGFNHHLGKPSTYKLKGEDPEKQPFYEVVKICYKAVGIKTKDPTRSVNAAIKLLKQTEYET